MQVKSISRDDKDDDDEEATDKKKTKKTKKEKESDDDSDDDKKPKKAKKKSEDDDETPSEEDLEKAAKEAKKKQAAAEKKAAKEQEEIERDSQKVVKAAKDAAWAKRKAELDLVYGAEKAHAKWWKEVEAEQEKRAKKGQKLNRFDGLYHSDNEDDENPESKKEFADGGVVSGANYYADKKPSPDYKKGHKHRDPELETNGVAEPDREILRHAKPHQHYHRNYNPELRTDGVSAPDREILRHAKHPHSHHSKAQKKQHKSESYRSHYDPSHHDPELIDSLNKRVTELKNKGQLKFKAFKARSQQEKEEPKKTGSYLHFVSDD